jgi:exopolysaccharide biosynthesis WecB/TagA/CpsF family protein
MSTNCRKLLIGLWFAVHSRHQSSSSKVLQVMLSASKSDLPNVCGVNITTPNLGSAIAETLRLAKADAPAIVFTLNLDHAVKLRRDARFRDAYTHADVVTADGWPIAALARMQDASIERATGADLFLPLVAAAAEQQIPIFLFGTSPGVMARVGDDLSLRTEGAIDIAGTLSPSSTFDAEGPEADAAIEKIRASGAKLCFVALGAPKQEIFANRARQQGLKCCMVCIGAALDFVAGEQIRAPKLLRDNGMEWAWRLASNPRRLAKRYAESAVMFGYLLATEPLRQRTPPTGG